MDPMDPIDHLEALAREEMALEEADRPVESVVFVTRVWIFGSLSAIVLVGTVAWFVFSRT